MEAYAGMPASDARVRAAGSATRLISLPTSLAWRARSRRPMALEVAFERPGATSRRRGSSDSRTRRTTEGISSSGSRYRICASPAALVSLIGLQVHGAHGLAHGALDRRRLGVEDQALV